MLKKILRHLVKKPTKNPPSIQITIPPRPASQNRLQRHVEELLWTGRWAFLRFYYLDKFTARYVNDAKKVLSLGCGYGKHEAALALKYPDKQIIGLDVDPIAIDSCTKKFQGIPNVRYICQDIFEHTGNYDFGFTIEVLEHIEQPWPVLKEFAKRVQKMLVMVPNHLERYDNKEGREKMW